MVKSSAVENVRGPSRKSLNGLMKKAHHETPTNFTSMYVDTEGYPMVDLDWESIVFAVGYRGPNTSVKSFRSHVTVDESHREAVECGLQWQLYH